MAKETPYEKLNALQVCLDLYFSLSPKRLTVLRTKLPRQGKTST